MKPASKRQVRLSPTANVMPTENGVILQSDLGTFELKGKDIQIFANAIILLLDGSRSYEEVTNALDAYTPQSVADFLDVLIKNHLVEDVDENEQENDYCLGQRNFLGKWSKDPNGLMDNIKDANILIRGLEPWGVTAGIELAIAGVKSIHVVDRECVNADDLFSVRHWNADLLGKPRTEAFLEVLKALAPKTEVDSIELKHHSDGSLDLGNGVWDLAICAISAENLLEITALAQYCHNKGIKSLYSHLEGLDAVIGPAVIPGETACWKCCQMRQLGNDKDPEAAHKLHHSLLSRLHERRKRTYLAPMPLVLGNLLSLESIKLISGYTMSGLHGRLMIQNLVTLDTSFHSIPRMPWCDICGGASNSGGGRIGGPSLPFANNSHSEEESVNLNQNETPEELRKALSRWLDSRTGIIRHLVLNAPEATDPELPMTATAVLGQYTEGTYRNIQPEIASGKGLKATEALLSAAGEAIERYSSARYRKDQLHRSSLHDLNDECIDPYKLCLYDDEQYSRTGFPYPVFNPKQEIDWVQGFWADSGSPVWLPALPAYYNFYAPPEETFCQVTSSGLAAGCDRDDAAISAIFELVERDAFMLTWLCKLPAHKIIMDTDIDVGIHEVIRQLEEQGARIELFDLDVGLPIATVMCLALGDGQKWPGATIALGSHTNVKLAAQKAILEQGHVGPYIKRLMLGGCNPIPKTPDDVVQLIDHALYYCPVERQIAFDFLTQCDVEPYYLSKQKINTQPLSLKDCATQLATAGIRVAIKNLTSPDIEDSPFKVARALGTNAQQIHFGYHKRRLGNERLRQFTTDGGLNPNPHPLA